ncbi:MAG: DUF58 domain-containing protein [Planctomycetota bacterium]
MPRSSETSSRPKHEGVLRPEILDRLAGLELVARRAVEGFMAGQHASPQRGSSVEFAQYRAYAPGDETRRIDWRVFARSERLVVKEYVEETNLSLNLLVDASESMGFRSLGWSKFDYARWAAASLAHLVLTNRDTAGLVLFDDEVRGKVPPANGTPQEVAILRELEKGAPGGGTTAVGSVLEALAPRLRHRGITVVFSDFFDDVDAIMRGVRRLVHGGHELILVQVLDPLETTFDLSQLARLEGLEGAGRLKVDPRALREAYLEEQRAHTEALKTGMGALALDFLELTTAEPLDVVLSTYLARRLARARGGSSA